MRQLPVGLAELQQEIEKLDYLLKNSAPENGGWWLLCNEVAIKIEDLIPDLTWRPFSLD
jgi:hypothetical protein